MGLTTDAPAVSNIPLIVGLVVAALCVPAIIALIIFAVYQVVLFSHFSRFVVISSSTI